MAETEDTYDEAYEDSLARNMASDTGGNQVYDEVGIKNKLIEPDKALSDDLAISNFQLGNISDTDYYGNLHDVNFALDCIDMPFEEGGFFINEVGYKVMRRLDMAHIMSGSKNAKKWDALTQEKKINILQRDTIKKKGFSMFKRNK